MKSLCLRYNENKEHSLDYLGFAIAVHLYWLKIPSHFANRLAIVTPKLTGNCFTSTELNFPRPQPTHGFANYNYC